MRGVVYGDWVFVIGGLGAGVVRGGLVCFKGC